MATDSSVAGFLAPASGPVFDDELDDLLQAAISAITGIPGPLVRPRWVPEPPAPPDLYVDWCSYGIPRWNADTYAFTAHDPSGNGGAGSTIVERDIEYEVLHSFYGPHCGALCERYRNGLDVPQNRDGLRSNGLVLVEVRDSVVLPALIKEKWVKRIDVTVIYRRRSKTVYPIRTIESGQLGLDNERYVTPITISNP